MMLNVVHLLSNRTWGGGERYALDLCRRLAADGHSVAVVTRGYDAVDRHIRDAGITPGKLPLKGSVDFLSPIVLARVLNRMSAPIVVHVHNFKDAQTALKARRLMAEPSKVRVVATRHIAKSAKTDRSSADMYSDLDAIVFSSEYARNAFTSGLKHTACSLHTIPMAVPEAAGVETVSTAADSTLQIVCVGEIGPGRAYESLIEALGAMPDTDWHLSVVGSGKGRYVMPVVRRARSLGIDSRISWLGDAANPESVIGSADVGVTMTAGPEMLDFMARGIPPLCISDKTAGETIESGTDGFVFSDSDKDGIREALVRLSDGNFRSKVGEAARRKAAERHSYEDFYSRILDIYKGEAPS